jgi:hypothetical protein
MIQAEKVRLKEITDSCLIGNLPALCVINISIVCYCFGLTGMTGEIFEVCF